MATIVYLMRDARGRKWRLLFDGGDRTLCAARKGFKPRLFKTSAKLGHIRSALAQAEPAVHLPRP